MWKWHFAEFLLFVVMIREYLVSLILLLSVFSSTLQIDSLYCPDGGSVRSMSSKLLYRLFILSVRVSISSPYFTAPFVLD